MSDMLRGQQAYEEDSVVTGQCDDSEVTRCGRKTPAFNNADDAKLRVALVRLQKSREPGGVARRHTTSHSSNVKREYR